MKEEDSKKKWCPCSRVPMPNGATGNRKFDGHEPSEDACKCIGSECMAWRCGTGIWNPALNKFMEPGESYSSLDGAYERAKDGHGYCGLAGEP